MIGLDGTGKTELAYKICETKRDEYLQTKGCRVFNANIGILKEVTVNSSTSRLSTNIQLQYFFAFLKFLHHF